MSTFHLTVARVGENLFDGDAQSVSLPGAEGEFQVLAHHEAFVSPLKRGQVRVVDKEGKEHRYEIADTGIAEVSRNQATVLL